MIEKYNKNLYSLESEQMVLACLIIYNNSWNDIYQILKKESFYFKKHKILFSIILNLLNQNIDFDINKIYDKVKYHEGFDFLNYINFIVQKTPNPNKIKFYVSIVQNNYILREIINLIYKFSWKILNIENNENISIEDFIKQLENILFNISKNYYINQNSNFYSISDILVDYVNNKLPTQNFYETGFKSLDKLMNGLYKGDFIIIAGRPSVGKTSFSLNITKNISEKYDIPVIIFSMEMTSNQLFMKILSSVLEKKQDELFNDVKNKNFALEKTIFNKICSLKIFIDESSNISISDIYFKCKYVIKKFGNIGLIIIDYLQLIKSEIYCNQNRNFEISEISRSLKCLAKELDIPVIALSQLNRNMESRNNKKPLMSDLRESGSIEQDADIIIFIHKEVNKLDQKKNNINIILSKNRKGSTGEIDLIFNNEISKFNDDVNNKNNI